MTSQHFFLSKIESQELEPSYFLGECFLTWFYNSLLSQRLSSAASRNDDCNECWDPCISFILVKDLHPAERDEQCNN